MLSSIGSSGIGIGGNAHAQESGKTGEETAYYKGHRHEYVDQTGKDQGKQNHAHDYEEDRYALVLSLQVSVGTAADRSCDLLHQICTLALSHYSPGENERISERSHGTDRGQNHQIEHFLRSLLMFTFLLQDRIHPTAESNIHILNNCVFIVNQVLP